MRRGITFIRLLGGITPMPEGCAINTSTHPRWDENATHYGSDNFNFKGLPGGYRDHNVTFYDVGAVGYWWSISEGSLNFAWMRGLTYKVSTLGRAQFTLRRGLSVRCVKKYYGGEDDGTMFTSGANIYEDGDGNSYDTIKIGDQLWTVENLYTTKYQNGDTIDNITDQVKWSSLTTGAYCWYDNNYSTYGQYYGALYNWYAVNNGLVIGDGWSVPSDNDWTELRNLFVSNYNIFNTEGRYLKSCRQVNHPLA